jgi:pimeloyl-ACP methyl ester carboxylesterase
MVSILSNDSLITVTAPLPLHSQILASRGLPTLVFVHGVTRCGSCFERLWPAFTSHYDIHALDLRGHGHSPRGASYLVADYAEDVSNYIESLPGPVLLFGHSLGAMVCAQVAGIHSNVQAVVLEDPPFHTMGERIASTGLDYYFGHLGKAAGKSMSVEELGEMVVTRDGKQLRELREPAFLASMAEYLAHVAPAVFAPIREGRWLDGYDVQATLLRLNCPALLLQADPAAGGMLSNEDCQWVAAQCPSVRVESITGAGHQLHWLAQDRVTELAQHWFEAHCAGNSAFQ